MSTEPAWSSTTTAAGKAAARDLLSSGKWKLSSQRSGLEAEYTFKGFNKAMAFWSLVAEECKRQKHHPEWANVYSKVVVRWTTHNPKGLSDKDVEMATFCDRAAEEVGGAVKTHQGKSEQGGESDVATAGEKGVLDSLLPDGENCDVCAGPKK